MSELDCIADAAEKKEGFLSSHINKRKLLKESLKTGDLSDEQKLMVLARKAKKVTKMAKRKLERQEEFMKQQNSIVEIPTSLAPPTATPVFNQYKLYNNIYVVPKKLMIFDLNKVLIYRQQKTSNYRLRPHAHEFLAEMAKRYTLAVWTSMTKKCAKKILPDIFPRDEFSLLFTWFQPRCQMLVNPLDRGGKPIFTKDLRTVWHLYRQYNETNTILLDDTVEKCTMNPPFTCIHPSPFELPAGTFKDEDNPYYWNFEAYRQDNNWGSGNNRGNDNDGRSYYGPSSNNSGGEDYSGNRDSWNNASSDSFHSNNNHQNYYNGGDDRNHNDNYRNDGTDNYYQDNRNRYNNSNIGNSYRPDQSSYNNYHHQRDNNYYQSQYQPQQTYYETPYGGDQYRDSYYGPAGDNYGGNQQYNSRSQYSDQRYGDRNWYNNSHNDFGTDNTIASPRPPQPPCPPARDENCIDIDDIDFDGIVEVKTVLTTEHTAPVEVFPAEDSGTAATTEPSVAPLPCSIALEVVVSAVLPAEPTGKNVDHVEQHEAVAVAAEAIEEVVPITAAADVEELEEEKPSAPEDCELRIDGPLYAYLDAIAKYDGSTADVMAVIGVYTYTTEGLGGIINGAESDNDDDEEEVVEHQEQNQVQLQEQQQEQSIRQHVVDRSRNAAAGNVVATAAVGEDDEEELYWTEVEPVAKFSKKCVDSEQDLYW